MLWAVLQFALPAVASTADALVERESRAQVAHVESGSSTTCRPSHPTECALCQLISHEMAAAPGEPFPAIAAAVPCSAGGAALALSSGAPERRPPARAPPAT